MFICLMSYNPLLWEVHIGTQAWQEAGSRSGDKDHGGSLITGRSPCLIKLPSLHDSVTLAQDWQHS